MDDVNRTRRLIVFTVDTGARWTTAIEEMPLGDALSGNMAMRVLLMLHGSDSLRPMDLLESAPITSGGMTKLLDRLETAGLVERLGNRPEVDGRGVEVSLTATGRDCAEQALTLLSPLVEEFIDGLNEIARGPAKPEHAR